VWGRSPTPPPQDDAKEVNARGGERGGGVERERERLGRREGEFELPHFLISYRVFPL
jgi:hypothetical protein